eukprot:Rhum_TRINITY_DN12271_c0_g1::Rhum_TRINITY_DN12271_c0_g1_i1::g.50031::m.50031
MGGTVCDPNCVACLRAAEKKEKTRTTKRTRDWELKAEAAHEEQQHSDLIAHRIRRRWREATEGELRKACDARGVLKKGDLAGVVAQYDIARVERQWRAGLLDAGLVLEDGSVPGLLAASQARALAIVRRPAAAAHSWLAAFASCCSHCGEFFLGSPPTLPEGHERLCRRLVHPRCAFRLAACRHCGDDLSSLPQAAAHLASCAAAPLAAPFNGLSCGVCGDTFTLPSALRLHRRRAHAADDADPGARTSVS